MSAFVTTPGLPLKQSSFVGGAVSSKLHDESGSKSGVRMAADGKPPVKADNFLSQFKFSKEAEKVNTSVKIDQDMIGRSKAKKTTGQGQPLTSSFVSNISKFYTPPTAQTLFRPVSMGQNTDPKNVSNVPNALVGVVPINELENPSGAFRNKDRYTNKPVSARPGWSSEEARTVARVVLQNILGNANLVKYELAEIDLSINRLYVSADIKEFVRAVGLSSIYRKRFFESCNNVRFIEFNFKHFLGRFPRSQAEVSKYIQMANKEGYDAVINAFIDSDEYTQLWGNSRVPQVNFNGSFPFTMDMFKVALLNNGSSITDATKTNMLFPNADTEKSISGTVPNELAGDEGSGGGFGLNFEEPISDQLVMEEIAWNARFGKNVPFWYKYSVIYKTQSEPVLSHPEEETKEADAVLKYGSLMAKNYV